MAYAGCSSSFRVGSSDMHPRAEIAAILCSALDAADMPWAVTHGAEGFPERVGRDFDILLPERFHGQAVALIKRVAGEQGWGSCLVPLRWAGAPVFLWKLEGGELHSFEMHFIDQIDWAGCVLADSADPGCPPQRIGGLSIATWPAFAKRVLTQILAGCWQRIGERPDDFTINAHEDEHLPDQMTRLFGRKAGLHLLELIRRQDLPEIRCLARSYRMRLLLRAFTPGTGVCLSPRWLSGKFARSLGIAPWRPPHLVLIAPGRSQEEGSKLLADVVGHLGFAKARILSPTLPSSLKRRLGEKWELHIHRSLFRLVATKLDPELDSRSTIVRRIGNRAFESGTFIAEVSAAREGEFMWSYHHMGKSTDPMPCPAHDNFASSLAYHYMESLKITQDSIK